jgi:hypothetical protein
LAKRFNEEHANMERKLKEQKDRQKKLQEREPTDVERTIRDIEEHARRQRELELERLRGKPSRGKR